LEINRNLLFEFNIEIEFEVEVEIIIFLELIHVGSLGRSPHYLILLYSLPFFQPLKNTVMNHLINQPILYDTPLLDTEWAIPIHSKSSIKGKYSIYKQTIQRSKAGWFKLYIRKEDLLFNAIYYCNTFTYFGNFDIIPMARSLEGTYRTLPFQGKDHQLFAASNQLILDMQIDEPFFFFCVQNFEEVAFEIEILCQSLDSPL